MYKIKELTDVKSRELDEMSLVELRARLQDMDKIIQRRLKGFDTYKKGKGISDSPAVRAYKQAGSDHISYSKNMSDMELKTEYLRGMNFLKHKTSTATEWDKVQSRTLKTIRSKLGANIKKPDFDAFFSAYSRLVESDPHYKLPEHKYEAFREILELIGERFERGYGMRKTDSRIKTPNNRVALSGEELISALIEEMDDLYERTMQNDELSGMFKLNKTRTVEEPRKKQKRKAKKKKAVKLDVDTGDIEVDTDIDDLL